MNDDEILKHSKNILKLIDIDTPNIGEVWRSLSVH